jgi:hypothetical protein
MARRILIEEIEALKKREKEQETTSAPDAEGASDLFSKKVSAFPFPSAS